VAKMPLVAASATTALRAMTRESDGEPVAGLFESASVGPNWLRPAIAASSPSTTATVGVRYVVSHAKTT
jgi:hypothetical protein